MVTALKIQPNVIGHRGACAYAPENTMASFTKSIQLGVKWVEFDVMLAACGEVVVFHDDTLERTTNGHGELHRFPYSYLRSLDAGAWFNPIFSEEKIPTLRQVIDFLNQFNISANVEIKAYPGQEERLVKRVLHEMRADLMRANHRFLFSSFSPEALELLRFYGADLQLGVLLHEWEDGWQKRCRQLNCQTININHEIMTPDAAKEVRAMAKPILCYTVNDLARAMELHKMGVDAVFSDIPDRVIV
jgi:glycerophosphoryl diester phosphodiesterase